ncbi:1c08cbc8-c040-42e5-b710-4f606c38871c [Sclerotinia trifoliorum]|uniref:1c08cbc8-c040-42e5-b710-4f606c38871c n=1 Tax=Sclerotinia trifoliorum TaxID=28548 RepID=A0A8H2VP82_9HELO|nr:1c08cbc8-c040-42e5-b710-4f606c38871c [Sclerotinia trifoliorum]
MSVFMANTSPERSSADGPLLPALMLGQNNKSAATDKAIPDTLDTGNFSLGPASAESDADEAIGIDSSSLRGEDGPLLFALLLNNQNNNNNKNIIGDPVSDTLDPRNISLELKPPREDDIEKIDNQSVDGEDGPLLFALMLTNHNNNHKHAKNSGEKGDPVSDTLNPTSIALELKYADNMNGVSGSFDKGDDHLVSLYESQHSEHAITEAIPDVLEMKTQLLELHSPDAITEAIPDMLEMKTQLLELHSTDAITEAIPDVLEMKTQILELNSPGNAITNGIPVILKLNSQAQAAQIKALLQGQSIPVAISTKNTFEKSTPKSSNGAPIIGSIMQSGANLTVDESKNGNLSDEQLQFWKENGYLVIPNALPSEQKDLLLKTVHESAEALAGGGERVEKHSYLPGQKSYVHPCGRAIATLSDYAFNPAVEPLKRIQRIGCGIHRVMPPFRKAILSPFHSTLAKSLGYKDPRIIQSLIIVKAGEIGARVVPHQDGCSGFTNPSSCTTFWYALEDCSVENGCLAVAPGSHRVQPITRRCRNVDGKPEFVDLDRPVYAEIEGVRDASLPRRNENGEFVYEKLEVEAGTLILMHGNLMHTSEANKSTKSRVAFNFGVVEGELEWLEDNYLQPYEGSTEFEKL